MFHRVLSMLLILILANHGKWFLPNNPIFYPVSRCLDYWIWGNSSEHSVHELGSFITSSRYIFSGHCVQGILVVLSKATGGDLLKMVFLKILQISQENTSVGILFNKVAGLKSCNFIEKRLQHRCFPVKFAKILRPSILENICEWLFLY